MTQLLPRAALMALLAVGLLNLAGCERQEAIRVYDAPKDVASEPTTDAPAPVTWTVPAGWQVAGLQTMEFAAFLVAADHPEVRVTVIPLPYTAEQLGSNVNRWEGQLALPPTPANEVEKTVKPLADGHVPMVVVDLLGKDPKAGTPKRIVAAIAEQGGTGWFFKLAGPPDVVEEQKSTFETFLRSVQFTAPGAAKPSSGKPAATGPAMDPTSAARSAPTGPTHLEWAALPAGWVFDPTPSQYRAYSFKISGTGGEGELAVTRMSQQVAKAPLVNINMWRQDVGLPAVTDGSGLTPINYTLKDRPGVGFDIAGADRRILVVMAGSGEELWFFKLRGPIAFVEGQRASLESFLKSVSFVGDAH